MCSPGLSISACARCWTLSCWTPRHTGGRSSHGERAYPDLDTKAAVLLVSIVRHHALVDGNKRLGWLATVVFYGLDDVLLEAPDDDAYELVMAKARGEPTGEAVAAALGSWD
jgi:death-on-curing protein